MQEISVVFEDENMAVLNKPAGVTVNRSDTTRNEVTLQDWIEGKWPLFKAHVASEELSNENIVSEPGEHFNSVEEFYKRSGMVHRLDKETSGIILIAKNPKAFFELQRQFREREVKKTYTALAHGKIAPEEGEISVPVGRLPWNRKRFGIIAGGRDATTGYKVLRYYRMKDETLTLLELFPKTGRTHQIRVHLKYMNRPIFADNLYGGRKTAREDRKLLDRQFLHASSINFSDPVTGLPLSFQSQLPVELNNLLLKLETI